jgi:hypothetical protein
LELGAHLEAPMSEIEVAPGRRDVAKVTAGLGGEPALRVAQPSRAQPHGRDHLGRLEVHVGDGDARQVQRCLNAVVTRTGSVSSRERSDEVAEQPHRHLLSVSMWR